MFRGTQAQLPSGLWMLFLTSHSVSGVSWYCGACQTKKLKMAVYSETLSSFGDASPRRTWQSGLTGWIMFPTHKRISHHLLKHVYLSGSFHTLCTFVCIYEFSYVTYCNILHFFAPPVINDGWFFFLFACVILWVHGIFVFKVFCLQVWVFKRRTVTVLCCSQLSHIRDQQLFPRQ